MIPRTPQPRTVPARRPRPRRNATLSAIACASCPQWTGVAGDSYRNQHGEVLACAQGVLDQIQAALSLVPAFDEERNHAFARSLAEAAVSQPELLALGAW